MSYETGSFKAGAHEAGFAKGDVDRRAMLVTALAGAGLAIAAAGSARAEGEHDHHMHDMAQPAAQSEHAAAGHDHHAPAKHQALVDIAIKCVGHGEVCISHCMQLLSTGDTSLKDCMRSVQMMMPMCLALARAGALDAARLKDVAKVCSDICEDCAAECKKHAEHHASCKACGESCRECIEECKKVI